MGPFARWAYVVARRRRAVLIGSALAVLAGLALTPVFQSKLLGVGYDTPGTESYRATQTINEHTGYTERLALVISSERYTTQDAAFKTAIARGVATVKEVDDRALVLPPGARHGGATSPDGRAAYAVVALTGDAARRQSKSHELQEALDRAMPPGIEAGVTGNSPLLADLIHVEEIGMLKAEVVGLPIAGLILLIAFGSVVAAGLPLLLGLCGLLVTFGLIALAMFVMDFNSFVESLVAMIGLGVGIDYALLIVRRFRDERGGEGGPADAMARTLGTAGRTITFSGAIVATSLLPVAVFDLPFFGEAAIGCMIVVAVMVVLSLTLLPALLLGLGDRLDRWSLPKRGGPGAGAGGNGWERWARAVMRRPRPILVAGIAVLLLAAVPVAGLQTGVDLNARAMPKEESVKALTALEDHFPAAALAPLEVLVQADRGSAAAATDHALGVLRADARLAGVQTQPLGADAVLLQAIPRVGVDTNAAEQLIRDLRAEFRAGAPPGTHAAVTGVTAETVDFSDETNNMTPWVVGSALLLSFVLLLGVFRSPVLAVKAIVLNLLSVGASFGLVVLVFQHGFGEDLLGFTSPGYIQSWTPLTLFMLLFGLSMDYEVFLVTRMREEWERTGDTVGAVAFGLQRTGGVVTSAAAIMVAIFASFILNPIPEMKQVGFGLAAAVLIDATIVRAALVPAFMRVAGRWNWWMPARLGRLLPQFEH